MHPKNSNHLATESSPYLLQHADNPVDWFPWGPEALELARSADKPVLLSIGYSACHWCHVMAHESFENEQTAAQMNELFVNIKVDREERPDLDKIYQTSHQLLTQRPGGWPLTIFLDPNDKLPFFAGTYFPPRPAHGMPSFSDVLHKVADFYRSQRDDIELQKGPMTEVFRQIDYTRPNSGELNEQPLAAVRSELEQAFDARHGGFGGAPKFPHPGGIERLLQHWYASRNAGPPDVRALHMASFSLESMIRGGVYDQLGGGFFRYSVDEKWRIPHFEKMLYDNGPLLALCAQASAATGLAVFRRATTETADWALREMAAEQGGFYSTLDADSEGEEGLFYAWDAADVRAVAANDETLVADHFGLDEPANFEGRHHLWQARPVGELAKDNAQTETELQDRIDKVRGRLFQQRAGRIHPDRDEKILTGWNAMMIRGLAIAARSTDSEKYEQAASRCLAFIQEALWQDSRLMATWKDGQPRFSAYLDDHAFLIDAILELLQCRWSGHDLNFAIKLADVLLLHFADRENGGFYFTADDHEKLFHRSRPLSDDSTPSGNAIAARALLRLGYLLGETRYLDAAENTLRSAWDPMSQNPHAHTSMINTLAEYLQPPEILVLRGTESKLRQWQKRLTKGYQPDRLVFAIPADASGLPEGLAIRAARGEIFAYQCRGHQCTAGMGLDELTGPDI